MQFKKNTLKHWKYSYDYKQSFEKELNFYIK